MRVVAHVGEEFRCPLCGQRYWLEVDDDTSTPLICRDAGSQVCEHLDPEVFPAGESEWEVYFCFVESESES
jgi:hypothetical protein